MICFVINTWLCLLELHQWRTVSIVAFFKMSPLDDWISHRKEPMTEAKFQLYIVAAVSTFMSPLSNPIIFYLTIRSFKTYVDRKIAWLMGRETEREVPSTASVRSRADNTRLQSLWGRERLLWLITPGDIIINSIGRGIIRVVVYYYPNCLFSKIKIYQLTKIRLKMCWWC